MLHFWQTRVFLACCFWFCCAVPTLGMAAQSEYRHFDSHISIAADGSITVQEIITEYIAQGGTRHGLFRDFPTGYRGVNPFKSTVPFTLLQASLDGKPVALNDIQEIDGGVRIFVRDNTSVLAAGEHVFSLTYKTAFQLGYFADYDELTWNVTGSQWQLPIRQSSCTISLPQGAKGLKLGAWLGLPEAKTSPVTMAFKDTGQALFYARRAIAPGEQLTVSVAWEKGFVTPEDDGSATYAAFVQGLRWLLGALLCLFALLWYCFGKDPKGGVIIPRFEPPSNPFAPQSCLSPAATGFISAVLRFEPAHFSALFINLGVKKHCLFAGNAQENSLSLTRTQSEHSAYAEENIALRTAFDDQGSLVFDEASSPRVRASYGAVENSLNQQFAALWQKNTALIGGMAGLAIAGAGLVLFLAMGITEDYSFLLILFALVTFFWCFAALKTVQFFHHWRYESLWGIGAFLCFCLFLPSTLLLSAFALSGGMPWLPALGITGISIALLLATRALMRQKYSAWKITLSALKIMAFFAACLILGASLYGSFPRSSGTEILALSLLPALFAPLMKRPSQQCRQLLDEIEGLALYIRVAEEDRLAILNPPEHTLQFFEKLLPYAVALGLEDAWGKKFSDVLATLNHEQQHAWGSIAYTQSIHSAVQQCFVAQGSGSSALSAFSGGGGSAGSGGGGGGGGAC